MRKSGPSRTFSMRGACVGVGVKGGVGDGPRVAVGAGVPSMILVGRPAADRPGSATAGRDVAVSAGRGVGKGDSGETKTVAGLAPGGEGAISTGCVRSATIGGSADDRAANQSAVSTAARSNVARSAFGFIVVAIL
jgi:hypothetical protein